MTAIRAFGRDLVTWLSDALKSHPVHLRQRKLKGQCQLVVDSVELLKIRATEVTGRLH